MSTHNLSPINLNEEKKKFLFDVQYNPQFQYEAPIPENYLSRYGAVSGALSNAAEAICQEVLKKWETDSKFLENVEGPALDRTEVTRRIKLYLEQCNLQDKVTLSFSERSVVRTHIDGYKMIVRLPVSYRENELAGMLHHEIGTHVFRRINDENQPWTQKRDHFGLANYLETEEGLAVLHGNIGSATPNLWYSAIRYLACEYAATMSFSQVYSKLRDLVSDRERCFNLTLRAKRGLTDTSLPGGFTKDQIYFRGVFKISKWLVRNDYDAARLYLGKIAVEDLEKAQTLAGKYQPILPPFMTASNYQSELKRIISSSSFSKNI